MSNPPRDLVGMARTGSGKSLAYLVPMIQRHAGEGDHAGDAKQGEDSKKGQSLRWGLIVGGEGLDEQFEMISNNPDV